MSSKKALFILHYSPPIHGAAKVGDTIVSSNIVGNSFQTRFIKIKSSQHIEAIGKFSLSKMYYFIALFVKVVWQLLIFRPQIIYFTVSPFGFAFYRDFVVSRPIKLYRALSKAQIFYHYHAKGIYNFTKSGNLKRRLTNAFLRHVNIIFISKMMEQELSLVKGYKQVFFLKNGVKDTLSPKQFDVLLDNRLKNKETHVLYLSNMIRDKGYDTALELAARVKDSGNNRIKFHFAGGWSSKENQQFFENYVKEHNIEDLVTYHGLVKGEVKKGLFEKAGIFLFPTRYKKEVFPLSILEALSYGLPVLAFDKGAVSEIINKNIGLITDKECIFESLSVILEKYLNKETYLACRKEFLENYTMAIFEKNLVLILNT